MVFLTHLRKIDVTRPGHHMRDSVLDTLKTLTSLNKEVRPFFLSDIGVGGLEGYFNLAIIAFGAFGFIVPKCYDRLGKMKFEESSLLI